MARKDTVKVRLRSTESNYFYTTIRNKRASKITTSNVRRDGGEGIKKYDPILRKHVLFVEEKIDKSKK